MPAGDNYNQLGPTAYATKGKDAVITPSAGKALKLASVAIGSSVSGNIRAAIMERYHNDAWKAGQYVAATPIYVDDTTDAQSAATGDFSVFTTTNNNGFAVQAIEKFNYVALQVSQAQTGSPIYSYQYWNGSSYSTLNTIEVPASYTAALMVIAFHAPNDWAKGGPDGENYDAGKYHIRVRATTAPSQAVIASSIVVAKFIDYTELLAEGGIVSLDYNFNPLRLLGGSGLMAYFSTADNDNFIEALYREV